MKSSGKTMKPNSDQDFGEPWELDFGKSPEEIRFGIFSTTKRNLGGRRLGIANLCETQGEHQAESRTGKRIVECVNACAGMKDPAAATGKAVRELGAVYVKLADVRHQWEGRASEEGQGLLCGVLAALEDLTGAPARELRDAFEGEIYGTGNIEDRARRAMETLKRVGVLK